MTADLHPSAAPVNSVCFSRVSAASLHHPYVFYMGAYALLDIIGILAGASAGTAVGYQVGKAKSSRGAWARIALATLLGIFGVCGVAWCFASPPPLSQPVAHAAPAHAANDPESAIYLGNGCFWHTQYDFVVLEQQPRGAFAPGRADAAVTSLVGYAGGNFKSPGPAGTACYHGTPGTDYGRLGHSEAVSVAVDAANASAQLTALAHTCAPRGLQLTSPPLTSPPRNPPHLTSTQLNQIKLNCVEPNRSSNRGTKQTDKINQSRKVTSHFLQKKCTALSIRAKR